MLGIAAVQAETSQEEVAACLEAHYKNLVKLGPYFINRYVGVKINKKDCEEAIKIFNDYFYSDLRRKVEKDPLLADSADCILEQVKLRKIFLLTTIFIAQVRHNVYETLDVGNIDKFLKAQIQMAYSGCADQLTPARKYPWQV